MSYIRNDIDDFINSSRDTHSKLDSMPYAGNLRERALAIEQAVQKSLQKATADMDRVKYEARQMEKQNEP